MPNSQSDQKAADRVFDLLHPIFRRCVDNEVVRYSLSLPRSQNGYIYATDGGICVRMPTTPTLEEAVAALPPAKRFPKDICNQFQIAGGWQSTRTFFPGFGETAECHHCQGNGRQETRNCDDCEAACEGRGIILAGPCPECKGTGYELPYHRPLKWAPDVLISVFYTWLLWRYDAAVYLPNEAGAEKPVYFKIGEVEGVVMRMTSNKKEVVSNRQPKGEGADA